MSLCRSNLRAMDMPMENLFMILANALNVVGNLKKEIRIGENPIAVIAGRNYIGLKRRR